MPVPVRTRTRQFRRMIAGVALAGGAIAAAAAPASAKEITSDDPDLYRDLKTICAMLGGTYTEHPSGSRECRYLDTVVICAPDGTCLVRNPYKPAPLPPRTALSPQPELDELASETSRPMVKAVSDVPTIASLAP